MRKTQIEYTEEEVSNMVDSYLNTTKFQNGLNNLIINTLSNRKTVGLPRKKIIDRISSNEFVRKSENELIDSLLKALDIDGDKERELIQVAEKKTKRAKKQDQTKFDSPRLLNYLLEEFVTCDDNQKTENFIGDLCNFEVVLLEENPQIWDCLTKIASFMENNREEALNTNAVSFFTKLSKSSDLNIVFKLLQIQIKHLKHHISKFYKVNFDISEFYKININLECFNKMVCRLHGSGFVLKKIPQEEWEKLISDLLDCLLVNYTLDNPIYFGEAKKNAFGLSTQYILLQLFCMDEDLCLFKILSRNFVTRKILFKHYDRLRGLAFGSFEEAKSKFVEKYCFLWKHPSVLEQIYPGTKVDKKFLIYCWISIRLCVLGVFLRHKLFRNKFYSGELDCVTHFKEIVDFLLEDVMEGTAFTEGMKDNLFYLIKEIGCDFVLYCEDSDELREMFFFIGEQKQRVKAHSSAKMVAAMFEDFLLAFKENLLSTKLVATIDYPLD